MIELVFVALAQEAFNQLPSGAALKIDRNEPKMPCDNGPGDDRTFVDTVYVVNFQPGWPVDRSIPILAEYWTKSGYKAIRDERQDVQLPAFAAEDADGFRIGIELMHRDNGRIDAYLLSSSPCL